MPYFYSDPTREPDPHTLPDVEVFEGFAHQCRECSYGPFPLSRDYYGLVYVRGACEVCGGDAKCIDTLEQHWFAFGFPGCLWDSEPEGPFETEDAALEAARSTGE